MNFSRSWSGDRSDRSVRGGHASRSIACAVGALVLAATTIGAVITHPFILGGSAAVPLVLLVATATAAAAIAWARTND